MTWNKSTLAKIETEVSKGILLNKTPKEIAAAVAAAINESDCTKARAKCQKCNGAGFTWKRPFLDEGHMILWKCQC